MSDKINSKAVDKFNKLFTSFENSLNGQSKTKLHNYRKKAISGLEKVGLPTKKDENWRYTNLNELYESEFSFVKNESHHLSKEKIKDAIYTGFDFDLVVFVNGFYSEELSDKLDYNGLEAKNLLSVSEDEELLKNIFDENELNGFDKLNASFTTDGLIISINKGYHHDKVVQVLFINDSAEPLMTSPRNFLIAGENSSAKIIFNYFSTSAGFNNLSTKVIAAENTSIELYELQHESLDSFHLNNLKIEQNQNSTVSNYVFSFGNKLIRNNITSKFNGTHATCNLYGLYLGTGAQHIDNNTFIDHAVPDCLSNELYKGILDETSHGVFSGKIMVRQDAQRTNAYQTNKTILLTDKATIDTKPQLEIYADDVKCSHGATVGHLDESALFYLRSRGIPRSIANSMLIRGFTDDVISKVNIEGLKSALNHITFEHLHKVEI